MADILTDLRKVEKLRGATFSSAEVLGMVSRAIAHIGHLRKENGKLRDALGPFSCLGQHELTQGDFNRARRAMELPK